MRFDRALRDLQGGGDLLVAVAVGQEAQRSKLARRELHLRDPLGQLGGGGRSQVGLAGQHVADARHEGVSGNVLEDVRLRARLQRPRDVFIGIVRRQYHDACLGVDVADPADRFDPFHLRHAQVHQHDVWTMEQKRLDGIAAVRRLGDDLEIGFMVDDVGDARPQQRVVVNQQHPGVPGDRPCRCRRRVNGRHRPPVVSRKRPAATRARLRCRISRPSRR